MHEFSFNFIQNPLISIYFRTAWAVMGSPFTSIYFRAFLKNGTPKPAKSRQIIGSPAVTVEFHEQRGGGLH